MNKERTINLCRRLVATESLSCEEKKIADIISEEMRNFGFDEIRRDKLGGILGIVRGCSGGKRILFDAHIDHIGIGSKDKWSYEPYGARVVNGRIYGRGTSDMKGSLAAMISGIGSLSRMKDKFCGEVAVSASVMEEVAEGVGLAPNIEYFNPDFVIIGESSDLKIACGQRGRAEIEVSVSGKSAHSSSPEIGINAVEDMMMVVNRLKKIKLPEDNILGKAHLVLTDIISFPYPAQSVVPHLCRATYDRRTLPDETEEGVIKGLISEIRSIKEKSIDAKVKIVDSEYRSYTGEKIKFHKFIPAWKINIDNFLVKKALQGIEKTGINPQVGYYSFCTNGSYSAVNCKIPTIGFGPSKENLAHRENEYIEIERLLLSEQAYKNITLSLLKI